MMSGREESNGEKPKPIPGPRPLPLVGNVLGLDKKKMHVAFYNWMKEFGPIFKISLLSQELVIVNDSALMREVFSELSHRPDWITNELNFNGAGVTLSNFEGNQPIVKQITWRIFHDTYTDSRIREMEDGILDEFIDYLVSNADETIDVPKAILRSIATQFNVEITGNKPIEEIIDASLAYFNSLVEMFSEGRPILLTLHPWLAKIPGKNKNAINTFKQMKDVVAKLMSEDARKTYVKGEEKGMVHAFITRMEEENAKTGQELITDDNLFASCIIDSTGGAFRGTSMAIIMPILYMLHYPEIRARLDNEIGRLRRTKKIHDVVQTDTPFLTAYIMECLRLSSMVFVSLPHTVDKDQTIAGYSFKKNQTVVGGIWNTHHADEPWGDPFNLRPERFLDASGNLIPTSHPLRQAFIPFSVGSRQCKGIDTAMDKAFKYVSRILYRCEIQPAADKKLPSADSRDYTSVVALFLPPYFCSFKERE